MALANANKKLDVPNNIDQAMKVFEEHGDFIHAVLRFHVRNAAEVDDLFQDFFLSLISKPIPKEVQNVRGFLYRVLSDKVKDRIRRIKRYHARIYRYAEYCRRDVKDGPENAVIDVEETEKMFRLIQRHLPRKEALAVTLRYKNHQDTKEIAEEIGVKPRSVSRYVSVGLKKLRQAIGVNQGRSYDRF